MLHPLRSLLSVIVLLPSYTLVLLIRLIKWLIAPLALLIQMLIGVPLVLLRLRQPLRPRFVPLQESELPDAAWIALTNTAEALAPDGFVDYGNFRCDGLIQGATLWLRLLGQPSISALAAHIAFSAGGRPSRQFVEFSTGFADNRVLGANNLGMPYSLPAPAYLARVQLKDVWDPRALYVLHRDLVAALPQTVSAANIERAVHDPAGLLADGYIREVRALLEQGWLRSTGDGESVRLSWQGAVLGVWRQAWPLASLHLRTADRRSRQLLAEHGIDVAAFTGAAVAIVVDRRPLPEQSAPLTTVCAGYEYAQFVAKQTDPKAALEAVTVELECDAAEIVVPREFRYSFRGRSDQPERRIRRFRSFDILLDPGAGLLAVTAMDREFEQAADDAEWAELTAATLMQLPLRLGPWLDDLDTILPTALQALNADAAGSKPDSASLYIDEDGNVCWQVVAWTANDKPLYVVLNARTGLIIEHSGF